MDPDLSLGAFAAWAGLSIEGRPGALTFGAGLEGESAASRLLPERVQTRTVRSHLAAETVLGSALVGAQMELRRMEGGTGSSWSLHGTLPAGARTLVRWGAWHVRGAPRPLSDLWTLYGHGYAFLESAGVEVAVGGSEAPRRESGALLEVGASGIGGMLDVQVGGRASRHEGMTVSETSFALAGSLPRPSGPVKLYRDGRGTAVVASLSATLRPGSDLEASLHYRWAGVAAADQAARAAWGAVPAHRLRQAVIWSPRSDLRLGVTAEAISATEWPGFEALGMARIPAALTLGTSAEKSLWEERFRLQASLRNLLGHHTPLHPLGAAPGLSLAVGASAHLGR